MTIKNLCIGLAGMVIGLLIAIGFFQPTTGIEKDDIIGAGENEHGNYVITINTTSNPEYYNNLADEVAKKEIERVRNL